MSYTHTFRNIFTRPGETLGDNAANYTNVVGGAESPNVSESIPGSGPTDLVEGTAFDPANLQSLYMLADGDIDVVFDDGDSLTVTVSLKATKPYTWTADSGIPNPLKDFVDEPATVAKVTATPSGADPVQLDIRGLCDTTPA